MKDTVTKDTLQRLKEPRFKVIADYPSQLFSIGQIIEPRSKESVEFHERYPHLFKKLDWWEERKIEEMPKYIKFSDTYMDYNKGNVYRFEDWDNQFQKGNIPFRTADEKYGLSAVPPKLAKLMPATEEEYLNFKNK